MKFGQRRWALVRSIAFLELMGGLASLGGAAYVGVAFVHRPRLNALDRFGFRELSAVKTPAPRVYSLILDLGSHKVLIGAVAIAVLLSIWRDWRRACACIAGPLLAAFITESIGKPLVGGAVHGFGGHSYPSGTVTAVAAIATALALALPSYGRYIFIVLGAVSVCAVSAAVIAVRWHFATDALGGTLVGLGAVLFFDGLMHLYSRRAQTLATSATSRSEVYN